MSGLSWLGVLVTCRAPSFVTESQAKPLPNTAFALVASCGEAECSNDIKMLLIQAALH
jgi:hypothetical protein